MPLKSVSAAAVLLVLGACQGDLFKSPETICEESGLASQSEAFETCLAEQRRIAAERRAVNFRRSRGGPPGGR